MSETDLNTLNRNDERAFEFDDELTNVDSDLYEDLVEAEAEAELGEVEQEVEKEPEGEEIPEGEVETEEPEQPTEEEGIPEEEKETPEPEAPLEVPEVTIPPGPTRDEILPELEKVFQISDPDLVESLRMEPEVAIPKVLAAFAYDLNTSLMAQVQTVMPQLLYQSYQKSVVGRQAEEEFYSTWPDLVEHKAEVEKLGARYVQANPGLTRKQAIAEIGAMVMLQKKIPFDPTTGRKMDATAADRKPTAAPRPAGVGASSVVNKPKPPANFYEQLAVEDEIED